MRRPSSLACTLTLALFAGAACTTTDKPDDEPAALQDSSPPPALVAWLENAGSHRAHYRAADGLAIRATIRVAERHVDLLWRRADGLALSRSLNVPFWPTALAFDDQGVLLVAGKSLEGLAFVEAFTLEPPLGPEGEVAPASIASREQAAAANTYGPAPAPPNGSGATGASKPPTAGTSNATPGLEGGDIRSSRTWLALDTPDLIAQLVADPERPGAHYVQLFASRALYRATPIAGAAPRLELLATPDSASAVLPGAAAAGALELPDLEHAFTHLHIASHRTAGTLLLFGDGTFTRDIALADADGDGRFERALRQGTPAWDALALEDRLSFE